MERHGDTCWRLHRAVVKDKEVFDRKTILRGGLARGYSVRQERSRPLVAELEAWMRAERARLSRSAPVAKALDYMLPRWPAFTSLLDYGRICLTNNAAERALRGLALSQGLTLCRIGSGYRTRRRYLHADRHRQAQ